jgi:hypothetical protein
LLSLLPLLFRGKFGILAVLVIGAFMLFGGGRILSGGGGDTQRAQGEQAAPAARAQDAELVQFVSFVLDDAQANWRQIFAQRGGEYRNAKLVLFSDATQSGCGYGDAATGPFYCPADERVYIDLSFYRELASRFGAPGDFAQAYVVSHEIGHHVQNLLGDSGRVHRASRSEREGPQGLSVRLELQADCYAGIWAHSTARRDLLEQGDIDEGLAAAAAVGDDRLQRQATGTVNPETWSHGSSQQRSRWFKRGHQSGKVEDCDTFRASSL